MTKAAKDHLLRTLASVAVGSRILDVECEDPLRVEELRCLGFDLTLTELSTQPSGSRIELRLEDDAFDWVIADRASCQSDTLQHTLDLLLDIRRVLKPGGWVYLVLPIGDSSTLATDDECILAFYRIAAEANLDLAEQAIVDREDQRRLVRGIFRKVDGSTPV